MLALHPYELSFKSGVIFKCSLHFNHLKMGVQYLFFWYIQLEDS